MLARRLNLGLGFLDQGVISLGSILLIIAAAQGLEPNGLGEFALGMASVAVVVSIVRAIAGETLVVSSLDSNSLRAANAMLGLVLAIGILACGVFVAIGFMVPALCSVFWGSAVVVAGALLQDGVRYALILDRRSKRLLIFDAPTVLFQTVSVLVVSVLTGSVFWSLSAWGAVVIVATVFMLITTASLRPSVGDALGWLRLEWARGSAYAVEAIVGASVGYLTTLIIAWVAEPASIAAFRTTIMVFGLSSLVINFVRSTYMRDLAGLPAPGLRSVLSIYLKLTVGIVAVIALAGLVLIVLPDALGVALFGPVWFAVTSLVLAGSLNRFMASLSVIPAVLLRVLGVTWKVTRARTLVGLLSIGLGPLGAFLGGAEGALIAESLTYLIVTVVLSVLVILRLREQSNRPLT